MHVRLTHNRNTHRHVTGVCYRRHFRVFCGGVRSTSQHNGLLLLRWLLLQQLMLFFKFASPPFCLGLAHLRRMFTLVRLRHLVGGFCVCRLHQLNHVGTLTLQRGQRLFMLLNQLHLGSF